jgi:predicted amidohydrolase
MLKIALAQVFCPWNDRETSLALIDSRTRQAADQGASLVLFPELTVGGILKSQAVAEVAEPADGQSVNVVSRLARELEIAIGFGFSECGGVRPFNSYCLIDSSGGLAGLYRKNSIPKLEIPFWEPGCEKPVFELCGRRMAVAICWDATRRDLLASYAAADAEIILAPHAWDSDPVGAEGNELSYDSMDELAELGSQGIIAGWKSYGQMRNFFLSYISEHARDLGLSVCFVNQTGSPHKVLKFTGPSFVVDHTGGLIAESTGEAEQLVFAEIK